MYPTIAKRALRRAEPDEQMTIVGLAMCNAEREHHMLGLIAYWDDLTEEAQEHYARLARAAIKAMNKWVSGHE